MAIQYHLGDVADFAPMVDDVDLADLGAFPDPDLYTQAPLTTARVEGVDGLDGWDAIILGIFAAAAGLGYVTRRALFCGR